MPDATPRSGLSLDEDRSLRSIETRSGDPVVAYLLGQLRMKVEQLHGNHEAPADATPSARFRKSLAPHVARSITSIIANRSSLPPEEQIQRLRKWANAQGIDCASHEETVAALLPPFLSLADDLTEEQKGAEPNRVRQGYRDKARNCAARAVWFYDPALGDIDTCVRQGIARGWERYQPLRTERAFDAEQQSDLRDGHSAGKQKPCLNKKNIARYSFPAVFGYADDKTTDDAEYDILKQVAYKALWRCLNDYDPALHGEIFTKYAHPLVYAAIDEAWIALQRGEEKTDIPAQADDVVFPDVHFPVAVTSEATADETEMPMRETVETASINVTPIVSDQQILPLNTDEPAHTVEDVALRQDDAHVDLAPKFVPSRKRQRILASALNKSTSSNAAETASATVSLAAAASHVDDEAVGAAALEESMRKDAYIDYVKKQEEGSFVHTFTEAQDHLRNTYANIAKTDGLKILQKANTKHPKNNALQTASRDILKKAIASFAPSSSTKKLFRAHLHAMLEAGLDTEYKSHL